jgi:hypothetical protein
VYIINLPVKDNHEDAVVGATLVWKLCQQVIVCHLVLVFCFFVCLVFLVAWKVGSLFVPFCVFLNFGSFIFVHSLKKPTLINGIQRLRSLRANTN